MNELVTTEISPCPFCGSTKLKVESKHHGRHYYEGTHSATVRCQRSDGFLQSREGKVPRR